MDILKQYKILLIDDRIENLISQEAVLKEAGYVSDCAKSGKEGLKMLLENRYGLIILDVQMPEMSGFEVAELIKGNSKTKHIPIIFLSASYTEMNSFRKGHEVGGLDYLTKPVDKKLLLLKVQNLLSVYHNVYHLESTNYALEKKVIRAEISYQDLYNSLPQDVILLNRNGVVVNVNRTGPLSCGVQSQDILNKHYSETNFLCEIFGEDKQLNLQNFLDQPDLKQRTEFKTQKTDQTIFYGEAQVIVVMVYGKLHVQISINDITSSKRTEESLAREIRATKKYQSMLLSSQINPHFTFNALNSVQFFILSKEDVAMALNFIADFSILMRSALTNSKSEFIPFTDELKFIDLYLRLEQKRMDNRFSYSIEFGDGLDADDLFIPPMLIQPYLENAVIHGLGNLKKEGSLEVIFRQKEDHIICIIKDNGIGRDKAKELKNLRTGGQSKHQSMGMSITETRINLLNELYNGSFVVNIRDLHDSYGVASGTQVEITFPSLTEDLIYSMVN